MSNLEQNIASSENTQDNTNNPQPRGENPPAGQEEVKNDNVMSVEEPNQNQNQPQYDSHLIDQQNEEIRKEIEENSPLISDLLPLQMLEFEFSGNQPFLTKIKV